MSRADILIVDDVPDNLRLLSAILTEHEYEVRKALNGQMALTAANAYPPDLILLDITMPDLDGYTVCERLKADDLTAAIPVIFISALDDVLDKVKAFGIGGVDYITKPFQGEEVLARVENHLRLQCLQKQLMKQNILLQEKVQLAEAAVKHRQAVELILRESESREKRKAVQLEQTLNELKQAQAQLIQTEKMSGLGQMVAGIAHEINNPVSFIHGNIDYAESYVRDLLSLLNLYQQEYPEPTLAVQAAIADLDLDFVVKDLKKLLISMKMGSERIRQIVLSLRIFSRLEKSDIKPADLHEGIDNTLLILQHRLKATTKRPAIEVVKEYGDLPHVTCHAGQLNQVFMNLLSNAIDALESFAGWTVETLERSSPTTNLSTCQPENLPTPTICIHTEVTAGDVVTISIADNGPGMEEEVRSRIFDPFFTTKPVGKGTGLGLSISHEIVVEKHSGQLSCHSAPGEGTKFAIEIPLRTGDR